MNRPGARFVVLPTRSATEIFPHSRGSWRAYHAEGFNVAKGERVDLMMFLKTQ
jgi:hypothetical protein